MKLNDEALKILKTPTSIVSEAHTRQSEELRLQNHTPTLSTLIKDTPFRCSGIRTIGADFRRTDTVSNETSYLRTGHSIRA